jgi:hypothetical protein
MTPELQRMPSAYLGSNIVITNSGVFSPGRAHPRRAGDGRRRRGTEWERS